MLKRSIPISMWAVAGLVASAVLPSQLGAQSLILPGQPSPVRLQGWGHKDTTVVELQDYLVKPSAVKEVATTAGWGHSLREGGRQLCLFRASGGAVPQTSSYDPAVSPAMLPVWPLTLKLVNGEVLDLPVKAPLTLEATFLYKPAPGEVLQTVCVVGDFNGWNEHSHPLSRDDKSGEWILKMNLPAGSYPYQLVVNGAWKLDPSHNLTRDNGMGGTNSLMRLMPSGPAPPSLDLVQESQGRMLLRWNGKPGRALVYWGNRLILQSDPKSTSGELVVEIPVEAARQARSLVSIYTCNERSPGNDLLIPLVKGRVLRNAGELNRHDKESQRMYFVFVDRFVNGNPDNDLKVEHPEVHPKANYWGGDLQGVLNKIQDGYFDKLGINSIWISPIIQNPLGPYREWPKPNRMYSGYHGYWPISSSRVDRRFGDEALLRRLIDTAHAHGINVLLDYVANHVHQEHPLLQQHPDWITTLDLPDGRKNIRIWDEHRLTTWFDTFMPSLDLERPEVAETMSDSALFWLEQFPLDGFRHDATKHIPESFWRLVTRKIKTKVTGPGKRSVYQIGETFGSRQLIASYIGSGMLDAQFDFNLYFDSRSALARNQSSMEMLRESLEESFLYYGHHHSMGNITGNHDMPRFISYASGALRFEEDPIAAGWDRQVEIQDTMGYSRLRMLQTWMATIPGIPVVYYGDEWGMVGAGDPDNRRPMKFDGLDRHQSQTLEHFRQLMKVRASSMALQYGSTHFVWSGNQGLVMSRRYLQEDLWVALNRSDQPLVLTLDLKKGPASANGILPESAVRLGGRRVSLEALVGEGQARHQGNGVYQIEVPPYQSVVWMHP
jgi:glycosidase